MAGAAGLGLILVWYTATSEVPWLYLLATWVFAFIAAAYAYAVWNRTGLRLHVALKASRPAAGSPAESLPDNLFRGGPQPGPIFEGDGAEVEVGLDTTGSARGPAWLRGEVGGKPVSFGTGLVPRQGWRRLKVLRELRRGPLGSVAWQVQTSDALGFFVSRRADPDREVALVLPRFASLREGREVRELEASAPATRAGSGQEVFGVREFRPGDSLRRIHWRSTARHGELIVTEFEPPGARTLAIYLDPLPMTREVADQIARIAASEAWDCIRDGGRVSLWAPGLEPSEPRAGRDLWAVLEWLARYEPASTPPGNGSGAPAARGEVVLVTATADPALVEATEFAAARGGRVRAWVVGEADIGLEVPTTRVDTTWPL